jgi:hypothetical protein
MDIAKESKRAFDVLGEIFPHIVRALENGLLEARQYFEHKSLQRDGAVFSAIVRLHAREYLRSRRFEAEDQDFTVEQVNLCGLWLKIGRYHVKIWKISADDLAKALDKQASSGEQLTLVDDRGIPLVMDLAVYWTADHLQNLGELYLVQPRYEDPRCFDWIWSRQISQTTTVAVPAISAYDIPVEDISVERIQSET